MASNKDNILYIARDIDRAMGKEPIGNYFIITNSTPYSQEIKNRYPDNVFLVKSEEILDTYELLLLDEVKSIIKDKKAKILVFKNTIHIENLCKENDIELLNPSAELSEKIENKITQIIWLEKLADMLPEHSISLVKDIKWNKKPFVLQWSHGHTGDGTILIQSEADLNSLKEKFSLREAKVTEFINGPVFTVNIIATSDIILLGNISYQITGILPFTENIFSTIGNDWSLPHTILTENQIKSFESIAEKIGKKMQKNNWRGLFGIDVIYNSEKDELRLIEINARQPASTSYESELQKQIDPDGITTFDAHLLSLMNLPINSALVQINDGAQIVQRVTKKSYESDPVKLIEAGYKVIIYNNTKSNSDLIRIQSAKGIMETHMKLNKRGKEILDLI
jgi:hypothetical protein